MEFKPVVEIVQVHGVLRLVAGDAVRAEDRIAGAFIVDVAGDSRIVFRDGVSVFPFALTQASNCG